MRYAPIFDLLQMLSDLIYNFFSIRIPEFVPKSFQREMYHIVMMYLLGCDIVT